VTAVVGRSIADWITAVLRGEDAGAPDGGAASVLAACQAEEITPLVAAVSRRLASYAAWPLDLRDALEREARDSAARELAAQAEVMRALSALANAGVAPLLLKGTPLAYSIYDAPAHRGRDDTDLLVRPDAVDATRTTFSVLGYEAPAYSAGKELFGQAPFVFRDVLGLEHWIDVHWALSTARVFADTLTYDVLAATAIPVRALGPHARTLGMPHALLLACMHPVMHHRNASRLAWDYDVHLLTQRLDAAAWSSFAALAVAKELRDVARQGLERARARFGTTIPPKVSAALAQGKEPEPTAAYLQAGRGWLDELGSNVGARHDWRARLTLLREVAFPKGEYMFARYGMAGSRWRWVVLPVLHVHRGLRGLLRVASRQK